MTLFFEQPRLLVAFRRGEQQARRAVYERYGVRVWHALASFGKRALLSEPDLRDLHTETFVRAFAPHAALSYDGQRPYSAFITTIARNCARDWRRQQRRQSWVDFDEQLHSGAEAFVAEEVKLDYQRAATATRAWLEQQPAETRSYVVLRFIEGTSQRDMKDVAGISRRSARTRDAQVLYTLKAHLEEQGIAWRKLFNAR